MSPEYRKWPDVPDQYPNDLKSEIIGFIGEKELGNAIQQGFYFLRSGKEKKEIQKVILCPGREDEINDNQKKQALKEKSDWFLVHGIQDCFKTVERSNKHNESNNLHSHGKRYRGKHRSYTKGSYILLHRSEAK